MVKLNKENNLTIETSNIVDYVYTQHLLITRNSQYPIENNNSLLWSLTVKMNVNSLESDLALNNVGHCAICS